MNVIGHQHKCEKPAAVLRQRFTQVFQIDVVIVFVKKGLGDYYRSAQCAALCSANLDGEYESLRFGAVNMN